MIPNPTISKSQYIKGLQCPLALWFYRNRKDLKPETDFATQMRFSVGLEVGALAQMYYPDGVKVTESYWDIKKAVQATQQLITKGHKTIYEATALHPITGSYARVDILRKTPHENNWDLIEVKSSTSKKNYHIDDVAFQYYVFKEAGFNILNCYLMLPNKDYVRQGEIDPLIFFRLENVTQEVCAKQENINSTSIELANILEQEKEPNVKIGSRCLKPFECEYRYYCWKHVPPFSIYDIYPARKADEVIKKTKSFNVEDIESDLLQEGNKAIEVNCHKAGSEYLEKDSIKRFLCNLEYPLYFLDYETLNYAIPLFEGTRPYQQIPFQFSLHKQTFQEEVPKHFKFLHKEKTDPRPAFLNNLFAMCGKVGSIVVYNQSFEITRNKELAADFPEAAKQIYAINKRIIDLMEPFRQRWLYNPKQLGSHSIKKVLPAYLPDLSYGNLDIANGEDAANNYIKFVKGQLSQGETEALWLALYQYCELDTYAMVHLLGMIQNRVA